LQDIGKNTYLMIVSPIMMYANVNSSVIRYRWTKIAADEKMNS